MLDTSILWTSILCQCVSAMLWYKVAIKLIPDRNQPSMAQSHLTRHNLSLYREALLFTAISALIFILHGLLHASMLCKGVYV